MKPLERICCMLLLMFIAININAQNYSNLELVENKGQWPSQVKYKATTGNGAFFLEADGYKMMLNKKEDMDRLFDLKHGRIKSQNASDSNRSYRTTAEEKFILHSHAYEMKFLHASTSAEIIPDKPLNTYNNYFIGNDPKQWASNCKIFQAVTYKNVYPGVDVRYYTNEGRLKYDLIINPGAAVDKIAMYFDGVEGLQVKEDRLIIKTSVEDVQELKPYTYQPLAAGRKEISNKYIIDGNIVRFDLGSYDKTKTLIIDPTLIFSTYSGSTADNWGYTATYDKDGNFYGGGIVFGQGFKVSNGAYQTSFQGGVNEGPLGAYDIGIIKLSPDGSNRVYATYLGGSNGNEQPHSLIVNDQGNLIIAGRTNSSNYPGTLTGIGGGWDIVLTELNATGTGIVGSRRIGGTGDDGMNIQTKEIDQKISTTRNYGDDARSEVIVDGAGNIYLASCTQSGNFPITPGVFQPVMGVTPGGGRQQDGVLIKASPDLSSILFSSFLGGNGDDAAFVLAINSAGNIYVAGATTSTTFPGTSNGSVLYANNQGGPTDGFISIISNNGSTLIKSTYVGTANADMIYGIQLDNNNFPYIMGTTEGAAQWPTTGNVTFKITGGREFICKLQADLSSFVYSTTFGKAPPSSPTQTPDISPIAFLVDRCENVYVTGWGGTLEQSFTSAGTTGLPTAGLSGTSTALRANTDNSDFYFFVLERNARSQLFGAFFGALNSQIGEHVDGGTSRFDKNGVIYQALCGYCYDGGTPMYTTPGSWSPNKGTSACNLAMVKIAMNLAGVATGVKSFVNGSPRKSGCIPLTVDFNDTVAIGTKYIWNFGDGSPDETTTSATNSHTYSNIGSYKVRLVSVDSSTCNITDTSYTTINVRQDLAQLDFKSTKLPPCTNLSYRFDNLSVPPSSPGKPFTAQSFRWNFGDGSSTVVAGTSPVTHTYPALGTYNVTLSLIDTNYCNYPDSITKQVRIAENVKAEFKTPPYGCAPYNAAFNNTSAGGQVFQWDFGDGSTSSQTSPTHLYNTPGTYTIKLIAIDSATCNFIDSSSFTITVSGSPTALFTYSPVPPQINTAVVYTNASTNANAYLWNFGDGDSLFTIKRDTLVSHFYNASKTFNSCLIAYNQYGCTDTFCLPITARVVPALDVPNAFTPNGDGANDQVHVKGFAIDKMIWKIYNRWGTMVFSTTNRNEGWDGKYKGVLQPQEVYTYTLEIQFSDGTKATKTGDITLIR